MKYVAFLRGINVGGKSIVKMSELRNAFVKAGFNNVLTYINSGNIIFESKDSDSRKIEDDIEVLLGKTFFVIKTVVLSYKDLKNVLDNTPKVWEKEDLRKYIGFIKYPSKPEDVIKEAQVNEGIDFIEKGPGVVYMSTKMSGLTTSSFPKLIQKKIYQDITIRNYNTVQKLLSFM